MALAPFFERVYGALGGHLAVSRESLDAILGTVTVGIHCGGATENDAWIAEMTANLFARLYPTIAITGLPGTTAPLESLVREINPNIELATTAAPERTVATGMGRMPGAILVSARGWVANVSDEPLSSDGPSNPYAAMASSALACAKVFRRVFLPDRQEPGISVSLLSYDGSTGGNLGISHHDVGDVWFAGVGAVGNAALWAMGRDPGIHGTLTLLDPEVLSLLNLQRYVLGTMSDVGKPKVELGEQALRSSNLVVTTSPLALEAFAQSQQVAETIAISVDNVASRRVAQALLPRLVINGWTGDQALGASWHEFSRDSACLACLYHPKGQGLSATEQAARALGLTVERATILWVTRQPLTDADLRSAAVALGADDAVLAPWVGKPLGELYTDVVCGAVPLDVAGVGRLETVPLAHQSVLAGAMMAAELVKRTDKALARMSNQEPLTSYDNILQPAPLLWTKPRARERGCICGDPDYQEVYRHKHLRGADHSNPPS